MSTNVFASTTEDLYDMYDLTYKSSCDPNVIDTIDRANEAQILAYQYNNMLALQPFEESVLLRYKDEVDKYKNYLYNSYNKEYCEILVLEEQYSHALKLYNDYKVRYETYTSVSVDMPVVPTKEELGNAHQQYNKYVDSTYIGSLDNVPNMLTVVDDFQHKSDQTIFYAHDAVVYSILNGTVTDITEDTVTVSLPDYIYIKIKGLSSFSVDVGDNIKQGDPIGTTDSRVAVGLSIDDHKFNLRKLQPNIKTFKASTYSK